MLRLRRKKRFKLQWPEILGLLLLCLAIASVFSWISQQRQKSWPRAQAQLIGLSVDNISESSVAGAPTATSPSFVYSYTVRGAKFTGNSRGDLVTRSLVKLIPPRIMDRLRERGIHSLEDLSADMVERLSNETDLTFADLPEAERRALEGMGYRSMEEVKAAVLAELDRDPEGLNLTKTKVESESTVTRRESEVNSPNSRHSVTSISIRYDPKNPERSVLDYPGYGLHLAHLSLFVMMGLFTVFYFGVAYPWLKREGY